MVFFGTLLIVSIGWLCAFIINLSFVNCWGAFYPILSREKMKNENLAIRENEFSQNVLNDFTHEKLFSLILRNITIREN